MEPTQIETLALVANARRELLRRCPFLASIILQQEVSLDNSPDRTIATTGKAILLNHQFFAGLSPEGRVYALAHCAWHCALLHFWRRGKREKNLWDMACDIEVANRLSLDSRLECPRELGRALGRKSAFFQGMSAEEIYAKLSAKGASKRKKSTDDDESMDQHLPMPSSSMSSPGIGGTSPASSKKSSAQKGDGKESSGKENSDKESSDKGGSGGKWSGKEEPSAQVDGQSGAQGENTQTDAPAGNGNNPVPGKGAGTLPDRSGAGEADGEEHDDGGANGEEHDDGGANGEEREFRGAAGKEGDEEADGGEGNAHDDSMEEDEENAEGRGTDAGDNDGEGDVAGADDDGSRGGGDDEGDTGKGGKAGTEDENGGGDDERPDEAAKPGLADVHEVAEMVKQAIEDSAKLSMKKQSGGMAAGDVPGEVEELLESLKPPSQDWRSILADFVVRCHADQRRWYPSSRRHVWRGVYLPSIRSERLNAVVAIDTSGSTTPFIDRFFSELLGIIQSVCTQYEITLVECDCKIQHVEQLTEYSAQADKHRKWKVHGLGGTDFRPVFEYAEENSLTPEVLIYFTDGFGEAPEEAPDYPVIWAVCDIPELECAAPCDWGMEVRIPVELLE